jgi:hypothetical protein
MDRQGLSLGRFNSIVGGFLLKKFLVPLVLVIALALPGQAVAGTKSYSGSVSPSGTVNFKIKKKHKKKKVKGLKFHQLPITCDAGPTTASADVGNAGRLKHKEFDFNAINPSGTATLDTAGKVTSSSASGTVQIQGEVFLDDGTTGTNCDTGVLNWTASKGG